MPSDPSHLPSSDGRPQCRGRTYGGCIGPSLNTVFSPSLHMSSWTLCVRRTSGGRTSRGRFPLRIVLVLLVLVSEKEGLREYRGPSSLTTRHPKLPPRLCYLSSWSLPRFRKRGSRGKRGVLSRVQGGSVEKFYLLGYFKLKNIYIYLDRNSTPEQDGGSDLTSPR